MSMIQAPLGIALVILGTIHFANRDRTPTGSSFFLGRTTSTELGRTMWALAEVVAGFTLLFST